MEISDGLCDQSLPMRKDNAVRIWVEDTDDGVSLNEGLDLVEDKRPFQLKNAQPL